jgi:hypothetical protein
MVHPLSFSGRITFLLCYTYIPPVDHHIPPVVQHIHGSFCGIKSFLLRYWISTFLLWYTNIPPVVYPLSFSGKLTFLLCYTCIPPVVSPRSSCGTSTKPSMVSPSGVPSGNSTILMWCTPRSSCGKHTFFLWDTNISP